MTIALVFSSVLLQAQKKVESGTYNTLLNTFLSHSVKEITVDSLEQVIDQVVLIDSREDGEFKVSHLKEAIHVGYDHFDSTIVSTIDKSSTIVVYCSIGYRSEKTSEKLLEMGFTDVSNLYGGIFEWKNQDNPVVNAEGPTEKIHAYSRTWGIWLHEGEKIYD